MRSYLKTKDFSVTQEDFELLYDEKQELLITSPQPKELDKYYESDAYISHTDASQSFFDTLYQRIKKYSLKNKLKLISNLSKGEHKLLDVGSGTGDFLLAARNRGWIISGVEPNETARKKSFAKDVIVKSSLNDLSQEQFQVITLWHVLEHLPDLEKSITKLKTLLAENGMLIVAVPNFKSFDAKHYKEHWAAYDVPRHLWHFSRKAIEIIFSKHGFTLIETRPMWFDAFYVSILSEKYKGRKFAFLRGGLLGLWSNISAIFSKEHSSHIYILKRS